jgi:hypothetical protein
MLNRKWLADRTGTVPVSKRLHGETRSLVLTPWIRKLRVRSTIVGVRRTTVQSIKDSTGI